MDQKFPAVPVIAHLHIVGMGKNISDSFEKCVAVCTFYSYKMLCCVDEIDSDTMLAFSLPHRSFCVNWTCSPGCRRVFTALSCNIIYDDWRTMRAIDSQACIDVPWDLYDRRNYI